MGMCYDEDEVKAGNWSVETRPESVSFYSNETEFEISYSDLDDLEKAVKFAQRVRRDKNNANT